MARFLFLFRAASFLDSGHHYFTLLLTIIELITLSNVRRAIYLNPLVDPHFLG